jgi:hypothetical protein
MNALKRDHTLHVLLVVTGLVVLLAGVGAFLITSLLAPPVAPQDAATAATALPFLCLEGSDTIQGGPDDPLVCVHKDTVEQRLDRIEKKLDQLVQPPLLTR